MAARKKQASRPLGNRMSQVFDIVPKGTPIRVESDNSKRVHYEGLERRRSIKRKALPKSDQLIYDVHFSLGIKTGAPSEKRRIAEKSTYVPLKHKIRIMDRKYRAALTRIKKIVEANPWIVASTKFPLINAWEEVARSAKKLKTGTIIKEDEVRVLESGLEELKKRLKAKK